MQKKYVGALTLLVMASIVFPTYKTLAGNDRAAQIASNTVAMSSLADNPTNVSSKDTDSGIADSVSTANTSATSSTTTAVAAISAVSTEPSTDSSSSSSSSNSSSASPSNPAASPAPAADMSTLNLSLEDALKMAETGNSDLKLTDSKIQIYDKQNQEALDKHNANMAVVDEDSKKDRDLNYKRTQWTLDNAKHDRENQLKSLKVDITNQYQTILSLQQQANNTGKLISNLDTTIDQINLQIKLGLQIPSAVYTYNAQRSGLEAQQKLFLNNMNTSMNTLKQDLGIDLNRPVVLTSPMVTYTKFDDTDIDNRISKSAQTTYDIQKTKQDIDISQIEHDIDFLFNDTQNADNIEISIEDKKATLDNLPVTTELNLRTAYNDLKSKGNTVEADRLTVEADQINIDMMQKNIEVGTSSNLDLLKLQGTLLTDQNTMQQDVIAYMTAAANFQNSLEQ